MFEFCIWVQRLPATQLILMTLTTFCALKCEWQWNFKNGQNKTWTLVCLKNVCCLPDLYSEMLAHCAHMLLLMVKENKKYHLHVEHQALSRKTGTAKVHYCLYRRRVQGCTICFSLSHFISYGYISCCCFVFAGSKGYSPLTSAAHWICSLYQTTIKSPK